MKTIIIPEKKDFDWINIFMQSHNFEQCITNDSIFSVKGLADIATSENGISAIHPADARTLTKVSEELQKAVSDYYNQHITVQILEYNLIEVRFI